MAQGELFCFINRHCFFTQHSMFRILDHSPIDECDIIVSDEPLQPEAISSKWALLSEAGSLVLTRRKGPLGTAGRSVTVQLQVFKSLVKLVTLSLSGSICALQSWTASRFAKSPQFCETALNWDLSSRFEKQTKVFERASSSSITSPRRRRRYRRSSWFIVDRCVAGFDILIYSSVRLSC